MSKRRRDRTVKTLDEERQHGRAFAQQHFAAPMARGQRAGARRARGGTPADPASRVLCLAVAERPVLLVHLDQVDEHVLRPDAWTLGKALDDSPEQRLLLFDRARVAHRELQDDEIVAAVDPGVVGIVVEIAGLMFADQHEAVVLRNVEGVPHGRVDVVANGLAVLRWLALAERNADERHGRVSLEITTRANIAVGRLLQNTIITYINDF